MTKFEEEEILIQSKRFCSQDFFELIVVLGGGQASEIDCPPLWTQNRILLAGHIHQCQQQKGYILMLSAGTAHTPNFMKNGKPVYESLSSSFFLLNHFENIKQEKVLIETSSFDTITNAFFARTSNTDLRGWNRLLIITSGHHMPRSQDIFEHMFSIPTRNHQQFHDQQSSRYDLTFASVPNIGMSPEVEGARVRRERKSLSSWRRVKRRLHSLEDVHIFLSENHDLYAVPRLSVLGAQIASLDEETRKSYGSL
eukprot:CAMPEP_0201478192 /NCGR_PEP_ID=MMETSP0151_2-20130828/3103_1 /ASSEMBLY_ACC=CAM_ASM_000257 /TAXON_ID=200890 /ORGANISM="Paramoeba atlantica, Strain 621/1 / CCAP 1560/9" /LENGTH=253 /DNA_ID=CAMNT_0047859199 /DNA_START=208 /DNA_END=969 /DNA_ORIENTATION=-